MQPTDSFSVSRRSLDVEDYIDILRRHKSWIFGPFLLTLVASVVGVYLWPDSYMSQASIKITPQQISQLLIPDVSNQDIVARIDSLQSEVLSRSELTNLRNSLNLYPREKLKMAPEDLNALMRSNIRVAPLTGGSLGGGRNVAAFTISFSYPNRLDAVKVVTALVANMTEKSMRIKDRQTWQQTEFMRSQAEESKKKLDAIEAEILAFRLANPGKLPEQMSANMMGMQNTQASLSSLSNAMMRAQTEKLSIENEIQNLKTALAALTDDNGKGVRALAGKSQKVAMLEARLENEKDHLDSLLIKYTDGFGQVKELKEQIAITERQLEKAKEEEESKKSEEAPEVIAQNPRIQEIKQQIGRYELALKTRDKEIATYEEQEKKANATLEMLNSRLSSMPIGDQKWAELTRDASMAREQYQRDQQKLRMAEVGAEVENRKQGEILEPLDPPSVPTDPTSPNRPFVISVGAGMGLMLGLVLAGAREAKDTSLKNLKDVRAYTHMSILGSIPLLENDFVVRRRRRIAWLGWTAACLTAVVLMAGSVAYYFAAKSSS